MLSSNKEFQKYSKTNQKTLLNTFSEKEIKQYLKIDTTMGKYSYYCSKKDLYIKYAFPTWGLGISTDDKKFQLTDHTLFTFLKENNLSPLDFTKNQTKE